MDVKGKAERVTEVDEKAEVERVTRVDLKGEVLKAEVAKEMGVEATEVVKVMGVEAMEMVIEGTEVAKALGVEVGELAREATGGVMGTQYRSIRTSYYKNNLRENNFGGIASNRAWHMH